MKKCPRYHSLSRCRMRRKGLMKLIPETKAYACDKCNMIGFYCLTSL